MVRRKIDTLHLCCRMQCTVVDKEQYDDSRIESPEYLRLITISTLAAPCTSVVGQAGCLRSDAVVYECCVFVTQYNVTIRHLSQVIVRFQLRVDSYVNWTHLHCELATSWLDPFWMSQLQANIAIL